MHVVHGILFLSGLYPLWLAWLGNRRTTLLQAVNWAAAAWLAWMGALAFTAGGEPAAGADTVRYLALCLTGCAGVAVLGARRPGVGAWNYVLLGLLAVMLLPVAQGLLLGGKPLDTLRLLFLGATLLVGLLNYLPTRLGLAALLLTAGCCWELSSLADPPLLLGRLGEARPGWLCVALAPWAGFLSWRTRWVPPSEFDRLWLNFRDRFGLVWGQRVREQFNRAAANAGWPVTLYWQGLLRTPGATLDPKTPDEIVATLRALLRRFGPAD